MGLSVSRPLEAWDVLRAGDAVIDTEGSRWAILDAEGGILTVRRPDASVSRMQSSVLFWRGRKLVRDA